MPLTVLDGNLGFVRLWMPLQEFPPYLLKGLQSDPTTRKVEHQAKELINCNFTEMETIAFVKSVCKWGNYPGVSGRIIKDNSNNKIVSAVRRAHEAIINSEIAEALAILLDIKGLAVSFASKHLKFLNPTKHVVLDSTISARLGYELNVAGYSEFVADCQSVLKLLEEASIPIPVQGQIKWRVADVEMAVFQKLRSK